MRYRVVLDTNVVLAAVRSRLGASSLLLRRLALNHLAGAEEFEVHLSTTLALEYEEILERYRGDFGWSSSQVSAFLRGLMGLCHETPIYFRWRPFLRDAEMVVEVALTGSCTHIITFNERDLRPAQSLNLQVMRPGDFLQLLDAPNQTS